MRWVKFGERWPEYGDRSSLNADDEVIIRWKDSDGDQCSFSEWLATLENCHPDDDCEWLEGAFEVEVKE